MRGPGPTSEENSRWESFAVSDPLWFIFTSLDSHVRPGETRREAFFRSGQESADEILAAVQPFLGEHGTALEIGPGVGRLTLAMSSHFDSVRAVDASPTMLEQLRENARGHGCKNIETFLPHQGWDHVPALDFVYSRLVFQHIENAKPIAEYVRRIGAALSPTGCAFLQLDTRPRSLDYRLRNVLPDWVLPRTQRRGIRRIRRPADWFDELVAGAGLVTLEERSRGTATHTYVLGRT